MSLTRIQEGIRHSLKKSNEHLSGAEALISINNLDDAVILIGFAIEEFGRAVALREKVKSSSGEVEKVFLYAWKSAHDAKYEKAWSVLPESLKTIYEKPISWWGDWWEGWWGTQRETISHKTRVNATFVNYDPRNKEWKIGVQADKEKLEIIIRTIRKHIERFKES